MFFQLVDGFSFQEEEESEEAEEVQVEDSEEGGVRFHSELVQRFQCMKNLSSEDH